MLILAIILLGLVAGWIADLIVNQRSRPDSWGRVFVLGLIGSFVGGLLFSLIAGDGLRLRPSGVIGSTVGALLLTAVVSRRQRTV